ncbi:TolC family protein [Pseudoduganella sp. SL102]|uniref:TolC family protein n=1 Tax=Pseudoduganella sp. SL102 TaxID=2995154 RepID=UPI00248B881C|nr:TolC family protein [Pseudoduganella sp. SL102]WBS03044.1 TolC family protein [Pseudoduganella sp. SL102]
MFIQPGRRFVPAVVLALACGIAAAGEPATVSPLDLPAAIALAAERHPALRAAAHEASASAAAVEQAGRLPNPELAYLREGHRAGSRTTTVQVSQPLELGGKRKARIAVAQGAFDLAASEHALRRQALRADVIEAFYTALVAGERVQLAQATVELAGKGLQAADGRVAAGKVSPVEASKARVAHADARADLARAAADLAIARNALGALVGEPLEARELAGGAVDALPPLEALPALLQRGAGALSVRRARQQLTYRQAQADAERAARMPDVTLTIGSQRDDQLAHRQAVVGLAIPLPLFDRNGGNLAAAVARTDGARAELEAAELAAHTGLAAAHLRYGQARGEALLLAQDVVPEARNVHALTLKGFEYGKFTFLDVLDAQRTYFQARARQWQAMLDAWRAHADIERLAGPAQPD